MEIKTIKKIPSMIISISLPISFIFINYSQFIRFISIL